MRYFRFLAAALLAACLVAGSADLNGKWTFVFQTDDGERTSQAMFQTDGDKVSGKWEKADVKGTFVGGKLELAFPLTSDEAGMTADLKISGKLEGQTLSGTWQYGEYGGAFKATKVVKAGD